MNNKKGFTLVELLVVIVILGIVSGLSIPLIRNIRENNEKKEYITYMNTVKYSAKLYVDSYGEDMFGKRKSGCSLIRYSDLHQKGLLKDIPIDKVSCASDDNTFVKVVKIDGKYGYATSIGCGRVASNGQIIIDTTLSSTSNIITTECDLDSSTVMNLIASPKESASIKYKQRNVKLTITSNTGINDNMQIYYGFSYNQDTNVINNSWKPLPVKVLGKKKQKEKILAGETISITTDDLTTPANVTGKLYLVVRIDTLENLTTESWTKDGEKNGFEYFGPYIVDNTKPEFNDSTIVSSEDGFQSVYPQLQLKVTDEKYSTDNDLRMCISYDDDKCSTSLNDFKNNSLYEKYDANKVLPAIKDTYDSSSHTIYVTVVDAAGNYEKKQFNYRIARKWTLTYDSNGGNTCDPSSKSYIFNDWEKNLTWGDLCEPTRSNFNFLGWNTNDDGTGNSFTKESIVDSDITIYADWEPYILIWDYYYIGDSQEFKAPRTGVYLIELYGAQGGTGRRDGAARSGGQGGYVKGEIFLEKGAILSVYVGGMGGSVSCTASIGGSGGWNGGAKGGNDTNGDSHCSKDAAGGGGGATDVRRGGTTLNDRILVAGGGGGGSFGYIGGNGGDSDNTNGKQGNGSGGCSYNGGSGGGGGGYYGGKTVCREDGKGYGGSSYISDIFENTSSLLGGREGDGHATITYIAR